MAAGFLPVVDAVTGVWPETVFIRYYVGGGFMMTGRGPGRCGVGLCSDWLHVGCNLIKA
ncbi:hypothetical protein DSUL_230001 [Desulfovibrionales bacterium]